jgi:cellulose biosynthesis protein BcsQ
MKSIAFFNNKSGVGKTTLVYHLAWMFAELGLSVVVADLDPQANLTSMFLEDEELESIWSDQTIARTVADSLTALMGDADDADDPYLAPINDSIGLLVGDLALSRLENELSIQWPLCLDGKERAFRVITSLWRILAKAAKQRKADVVLIDVAPSLGALNRAALIAASQVVIPLIPDLYSIQGLRNLGPTLQTWRVEWADRLQRKPATLLAESLPTGAMQPVGYVVLQHAVRLDRPVKAYQRWLDRIPMEYRRSVLQQERDGHAESPRNDPNCLAELRHYRSLMPLAQEARKPMFLLTPADGALGGHYQAAQACRKDFHALALKIAKRCKILIP